MHGLRRTRHENRGAGARRERSYGHAGQGSSWNLGGSPARQELLDPSADAGLLWERAPDRGGHGGVR